MATFADIRAQVHERLVDILGDQATDHDVQTTCRDIYIAFMATLDLRPRHLSETEVEGLVESVDALWSGELEQLAEAAKQTLAESQHQGRSPREAAVELQTLIQREFIEDRGRGRSSG